MLDLQNYKKIVDNFRSSQDEIRFLDQQPPKEADLYVLDSSFNPPHNAHLGMCHFVPEGSNLVLLLSIANADKTEAPATLDIRLTMLEALKQRIKNRNVSIALCKYALFADKCVCLSKYCSPKEQIYLVGFDTLIRILNCKYYPEKSIQKTLSPFFERSRILCFYRETDDSTREELQKTYPSKLEKGELENVATEWSTRIHFAKLDSNMGKGVSSTAIRKAISSGNEGVQSRMIPNEVLTIIKVTNPYS
ncbi:nicotinamide-nucleotide adenylyltransferase [Schizosaccharomyces osmophilus]|uniref:Nicotinamide-nucleotide adenylyltransferase n=1 Tax=Schizosaccharomyces osmophilus TaxID=2545709 RepID=A0AAE9WKF2_9SCHI|nr:nicotinamide-nucleotide adenylyltransferase [Schizosaccharomyces osmophilus]WBW75443.1 nicotinamide-nucleotide adenylyltransferase [Schizosaccharomyces osmophilus]